MSFQLDDTVAALASAPGSAARGIIRISGPAVRDVLQQVFQPFPAEAVDSPLPRRWESRFAAKQRTGEKTTAVFPIPSPCPLPQGERGHGTVVFSPVQSDFSLPVDLLFWPTRRSYTGQPLAEVHTVGSPPILEQVLAELFRQGARPARPGEFTLRAFLAGRLDLMQAEAVLGVIDAHDHIELETALKQLGGGLSGRVTEVQGDLLDLLSDLEAGLDFVDEDIEFVKRTDVLARLSQAHAVIEQLISQAENRLQTTGRSRVVLAGLPNAGKSCLFNALVGDEAAIVSDIKGTTRDVLQAMADWDGIAVELLDTAGWESAPTDLMRQADEFRRQHSLEADVLVFCLPRDLSPEDWPIHRQLLEEFQAASIPLIVVETKADLPASGSPLDDHPPLLGVSAVTGAGLSELRAEITRRLSADSQKGRHLIGTTAARCRESFLAAAEALQEALHAARASAGDEIIAGELHQALEHLGQILGSVYTDDILDRIFSKFCIGK